MDGFWIDRHPVTNEQFCPIRRRHRARHRRRAAARSGALSRRPAGESGRREHGLRPDVRSGRSEQLRATGGPGPPARTGAIRADRAARSPVWPIIRSSRSRWRMWRPTAPGPGRSCRPRRSGNTRRAAGSTAPSSPGATRSGQTASSWPTAGRGISPGRTRRRMATSHLAGRQLSRQRLRTAGHGRQRLGMDGGLVRRRQSAAPKPSCCVLQSAPAGLRREGGGAGGEHRPAAGPVPHPAQGHQGRIAPVRPELLLSLPASGAPAAGHRHRDEPPRVPLRRPSTAGS